MVVFIYPLAQLLLPKTGIGGLTSPSSRTGLHALLRAGIEGRDTDKLRDLRVPGLVRQSSQRHLQRLDSAAHQGFDLVGVDGHTA